MERIKSPVEAFDKVELDEASLEHVSGGYNVMDIFNLAMLGYKEGQTMGASIMLPFKGMIKEATFKSMYEDPLSALASYNSNTKYSDSEKAAMYAQSWNSKHQGQYMNENLALAILSVGVKDPYEQAIIACLPTPEAMAQACMEFASGTKHYSFE